MATKWQTISLVVVLIATATGGYLVWTFSNPNEPEPNIPLGWQTYHNEEYGYEVSYPGDWKISDALAPFEVILYPPGYYMKSIPDNEWFLVSIIVHEYEYKESWREKAMAVMAEDDDDIVTKTDFQEREAFRLTKCPDNLWGMIGYNYCEESIFFPHPKEKNIVIDVSITMAPYQKENEQEMILNLLNQILATFRFLD